jgi:hypothetical protein
MTATHETPIANMEDWGDTGRTGVLTAARRHPFLVLFPLLIFVGAAVFLGLARDPSYTAESRVIVGRLDVSQPGSLAGFQDATEALAAGYSRSVVADAVTGPVGREFGLTRKQVRDRISATPVPSANVFRIQATTANKAGSIRLANATTASLIAYILKLNRNNPDQGRILKQFSTAALLYRERFAVQQRLQRRSDRLGTPSAQQDLDRASASTEDALLQRETYRIAYQNSEGGQATSSQLQVLAPANDTSSDRISILELLLLAGVVAGLLVGIAFATLRENTRRSTRAA